MANKLVFLDLETTGLDSSVHTITEIGLIHPTWGAKEIWILLGSDEVRAADPNALRITGYNRIHAQRDVAPSEREVISEELPHTKMTIRYDARYRLADILAEQLDGMILAGCNVKFDQEFLDKWMRLHDAIPTWEYHVVDVPTYAAGVWNAHSRHVSPGVSLGLIHPPFTSMKASKAFDVEEPEDAHTALGDAYWAKQVWDAAQREIV